MSFTPASRRNWIAAVSEPPVASMGSTTRQGRAVLDVGRELAVVLMRDVGLGIAVHANVAHARGGNESEDAVDHSQASAQDGDDGDLLAGNALAGGLLKRGLHLDVLEREVAHGLIALEDRELRHELAELLGSGPLVPQDAQLVLDQGVVDNREPALVVICHVCPFS